MREILRRPFTAGMKDHSLGHVHDQVQVDE